MAFELVGVTRQIGAEDIAFGLGTAGDVFSVSTPSRGVSVRRRVPHLFAESASVIKGDYYVSNSPLIVNHSADSGADYAAGNLRAVIDTIGSSRASLHAPPGEYGLGGGTVVVPANVEFCPAWGFVAVNGTLVVSGPQRLVYLPGIATLTAYAGVYTGHQVSVAEADGQGLWVWDGASTAEPDGLTVIAVAGVSQGRWVRAGISGVDWASIVAGLGGEALIPYGGGWYTFGSIGGVLDDFQAGIGVLDSGLTDLGTIVDDQAADISTIQTHVMTLQEETSTTASAVTTLQSKMTTVETELGAHATSISGIQTTLTTHADGIGANATAVTALEARTTTVEGLVAGENVAQIRTDLDTVTDAQGATASSVTTLQSRMTTAEGDVDALETTTAGHTTSISGIQTTLTTHADGIGANATAVTGLEARTTTVEGLVAGENVAQIRTDLDTVTDAQGATATAVTTLQTSVEGHTSSIETQSQSIDGLLAKYTVKVDVDGYVSGFGLASEDNAGAVVSAFTVLADRFQIAVPGDDPVQVFSVSGAGVVINTNVYVPTGSIVVGGGIPAEIDNTQQSWSDVSGTGRPADGADVTDYRTAETFPAVITPDMIVRRGNTFEKVGANGWDAQAYSMKGYTGGCHIAFKSGVVHKAVMLGLALTPAESSSYTKIDYCFYLTGNDGISIYELGVSQGSFGTYTTDILFEIIYDGSSVKYYIDGAVVKTVSGLANDLTFYMDSSFYNSGAKVTHVQWGPYTPTSALIQAKADLAQEQASSYADGIVTDAEQRAIDAAQDKANAAEAAAKLYTEGWSAQGADVTNYTDSRVANALTEGSVTTIARPGGGTFVGSGTQTGVIKITLPVSWTNTMLRFYVDVYNYTTDKSFTAVVGGYNYSGGTSWYSTSADIYGSIASDNAIRFGHDGTKCCIYIGETTSSWSYLKVTVRDFQAGYSNYTVDMWKAGWSITLAPNIGTITKTYTDALLDAKSIKNQGVLATHQDGLTLTSGSISNALGTMKIDFTAATIEVGAAAGLTVKSNGGITVEGGGDITVETGGKIILEATETDLSEILFKRDVSDENPMSIHNTWYGSAPGLIIEPTEDYTSNLWLGAAQEGGMWQSINSLSRGVWLKAKPLSGSSHSAELMLDGTTYMADMYTSGSTGIYGRVTCTGYPDGDVDILASNTTNITSSAINLQASGAINLTSPIGIKGSYYKLPRISGNPPTAAELPEGQFIIYKYTNYTRLVIAFNYNGTIYSAYLT